MKTWASPVKKTTSSMPARSISREQPGAGLVIAAPAVQTLAVAVVHRRDRDLVGDDLPAGAGGAQRVDQPAALGVAEEADRPVGGVDGAVLAQVEQEQVGGGAEGDPPVEAEALLVEARAGEPLERGTVGGRALELGRRGPVVGVVVLDLVVVPDVDHRMQAVQLAQRRVGAIAAVLAAVGAQIVGVQRVAARVLRGRRATLRVDVVAEEHVQVEVLRGGVRVRAEVPVGVVLAGREGQPQRVARGRVRQRPGAADGRDVVAGLPDVEVLRGGLEAADASLDRPVDRRARSGRRGPPRCAAGRRRGR